MTKKSIVLLAVATCCLLTFAQSQEGIVRTSGTAKKKGSPISGVILRPLGGNDVMSGDDGRFSMHLRQQLEEGDYFLFSRVFKKGYEPIDKDILKRRFVYSQTVPIEIVLISSEQLMKTKADIEEKARKKAEIRFGSTTRRTTHQCSRISKASTDVGKTDAEVRSLDSCNVRPLCED